MQILSELTLPARVENLEPFLGMMAGCAKHEGFGVNRIYELRIAVEEALVNICSYAYPGGNDGMVTMVCKADDHARLVVEIADAGVPFNVLAFETPPVTGDISERKIGGLGIHLMRNLMDEVLYERKGNRNVLQLIALKA